MSIFHTFDLSMIQWCWVIIAAFLVGFSKTGISGFLMPVIPIIASVFGGKESTGVILPLLIIGDVFALYYYNRHADWKNIKKLLPWTLIGLVMGIVVGNLINDKQFKAVISVSVLLCLVALIYTEKKGENLKVPQNKWFYALAGIATGFTSMIGNAAGPIFSVYLLTMNFKKNDFMGTTAWFFFLINLTKVPLQILFWHNISTKTIILSIGMIPYIAIGALLGMLLIKKINEKYFRYIIIAVTAIAAVRPLI
ncbi:sulfite exporter TauE/SafE family protein [Clostridium estertheticum]|uniref:Probable membrane transporter protein n=1 Tax=Clostridium estertheticum TaxID=238834 RepID=A0AA47EMU7_9CLOT|nr:sulfite exporter TauE/SafE family protein [Clostridium estertheticum]MBU3156649.1 sulfite exporter TauE/SafE family protein [Clostridium estertheticum]WAG62771.1 sulfite exporter TauE/SafE family protein [Clostridium estertheticum]